MKKIIITTTKCGRPLKTSDAAVLCSLHLMRQSPITIIIPRTTQQQLEKNVT